MGQGMTNPNSQMTKEQIEEARAELKSVFGTLAGAGTVLGKSTQEIAQVANGSEWLINTLCDLAIKGLSNGPSEREAAIDECRDAAHDAIHHAIERMDLCAFVKGHVDEALLALKNAAPQQSKDARDAARYRFLRAASPSDVEGYWWGYAQDTNSDLSLLDAVIDADMAKSNATEGVVK